MVGEHDTQAQTTSKITLILGGARSGKSTFAEQLATKQRGRITYLATAQALDEEMQARIAQHRAVRSATWTTVECPYDVAAAIRATAATTDCFLLDCLTLYVSNLLLVDEAKADVTVPCAIEEILSAITETNATLVIVSNEVGLGLVPEYAISRQYRDLLGKANQRIARQAAAVYFLVAGLPIDIKALAIT